MRISARGLNRSTLARQMLLRREPLDAASAVSRIVAIQAQQPESPYLALWNRVRDFDPAELDAAFAGSSGRPTVVKANMVRMTLHATHVDDYRAFREATEPTVRASRLRDRRFKASGLSAEEADAVIPELLTFAERPRTADEMSAWSTEKLGETADAGAWWALRQYAPLLRAPTGGPWSFERRISYVAPPVRPVLADQETADDSLQTLLLRYLEGFGPASVPDMAQFAMVQRTRIRKALKALDGGVERLEGPNGEELFDIPGAYRPNEDTPAPPRLMAMWDNIMLSYFDRSRVIPPDYRKTVIRANGDVLPTLLVDGYVAGVWRVVEGTVKATAFHPLSEDAWDGLAGEARALTAFLAGRDPEIYRRFDHWWKKLPDGEVRLLPDN